MKVTLDYDDLKGIITAHLTAKFGDTWSVDLAGTYGAIHAECQLVKSSPADDIPL